MCGRFTGLWQVRERQRNRDRERNRNRKKGKTYLRQVCWIQTQMLKLQGICCMSKKSCPFVYSESLFRLDKTLWIYMWFSCFAPMVSLSLFIQLFKFKFYFRCVRRILNLEERDKNWRRQLVGTESARTKKTSKYVRKVSLKMYV